MKNEILVLIILLCATGCSELRTNRCFVLNNYPPVTPTTFTKMCGDNELNKEIPNSYEIRNSSYVVLINLGHAVADADLYLDVKPTNNSEKYFLWFSSLSDGLSADLLTIPYSSNGQSFRFRVAAYAGLSNFKPGEINFYVVNSDGKIVGSERFRFSYQKARKWEKIPGT